MRQPGGGGLGAAAVAGKSKGWGLRGLQPLSSRLLGSRSREAGAMAARRRSCQNFRWWFVTRQNIRVRMVANAKPLTQSPARLPRGSDAALPLPTLPPQLPLRLAPLPWAPACIPPSLLPAMALAAAQRLGAGAASGTGRARQQCRRQTGVRRTAAAPRAAAAPPHTPAAPELSPAKLSVNRPQKVSVGAVRPQLHTAARR